MIVSDNSTEFTSNVVSASLSRQSIDSRYIAPGKPIQNASMEWFNGRSERLKETLFSSLASSTLGPTIAVEINGL